MNASPLVIAHRTSPAYAPENSLEGIRISFEQGADGVEIDLRTSLDLRAYLMHDNSMRRTTGWLLPIELTPSFVVRRQRLRRAAGAGDAAAGVTPLWDESRSDGAGATMPVEPESPPTLDAAIEAVPAGRLLAVDVKTPWSVFGLSKAIRRRSMQARTLVWCSSAFVVRYAVRSLPGIEVAYYKDYEDGPSNLEFIGKAARLRAHAVSLDWRGINRDVVAAAHSLGLMVYSWHKAYPLTPEKLASGLDGLITDDVAQARTAIGRPGEA